MIRSSVMFFCLVPSLFLTGCFGGNGPEPTDKKPTFPVSGVLSIDGKPTEGVYLFVSSAENLVSDQSSPYLSSVAAITDSAGKFSFSTYVGNDGLPEGNYVLTAYWTNGVPVPLVNDNFDEGPKLDRVAEQFNQKYGCPATCEIKFTVAKVPLDMGIVDLTTN